MSAIKQEEMVLNKAKEQVEPELIEEIEEEKKARRGIKGGRILENLKNTLSDIFDETDVKM